MDFSAETWFDDIWIKEMHFVSILRQPADRFTNVIIDVAQTAETLEAKVKNSQFLVFHCHFK